jgi:hypothetical protein
VKTLQHLCSLIEPWAQAVVPVDSVPWELLVACKEGCLVAWAVATAADAVATAAQVETTAREVVVEMEVLGEVKVVQAAEDQGAQVAVVPLVEEEAEEVISQSLNSQILYFR